MKVQMKIYISENLGYYYNEWIDEDGNPKKMNF